MRRSQFVKLVGLTEEAFNLLRARKHVPLRGEPIGPGWQEFSVEDALALEAATALARCGVKKNDARAWVDQCFQPALDWAAESKAGPNDPVYIGVVSSIGVVEGKPIQDDQFPLVGTPSDIAEQLSLIRDALGPDRWLDGVITINLNLCAKLISDRAKAAGITDDRLSELEGILC